jgi:hypothetical protein
MILYRDFTVASKKQLPGSGISHQAVDVSPHYILVGEEQIRAGRMACD